MVECTLFFSWSANVAGRKHWTFVNPCDVPDLKDVWGNMPSDLDHVDRQQYPNFDRVRLVECIQEVFVA